MKTPYINFMLFIPNAAPAYLGTTFAKGSDREMSEKFLRCALNWHEHYNFLSIPSRVLLLTGQSNAKKLDDCFAEKHRKCNMSPGLQVHLIAFSGIFRNFDYLKMLREQSMCSMTSLMQIQESCQNSEI